MSAALEGWQEQIVDRGLVPEALQAEEMRPGNVYQTTIDPVITVKAAPEGNSTVTITCTTPGASIAFGIDQAPRGQWQLYSRPLTLKAGTSIRAIATRLGYRNSRRVRKTVAGDR